MSVVYGRVSVFYGRVSGGFLSGEYSYGQVRVTYGWISDFMVG